MIKKVANLSDLNQYEDLGSGMYKKSHEVWRLEASGDGEYKLIRIKSEKLPKKEAFKRLASAEKKGKIFRNGGLIEVKICFEDGESSQVEFDNGLQEIVPSDIIISQHEMKDMSIHPEDAEPNVDPTIPPGVGMVDFNVK